MSGKIKKKYSAIYDKYIGISDSLYVCFVNGMFKNWMK